MKITNAEKIPVNMKISLSLVLKLVLKNLLIFLLNHFEITISVLYIFKLQSISETLFESANEDQAYPSHVPPTAKSETLAIFVRQ